MLKIKKDIRSYNPINICKRMIKGDSGNISVQFALILVPLLMAMNAAIDMSQIIKGKHNLQLIADSAAIAAASGDYSNRERQEIFRTFVTETVDPSWGFRDINASTQIITEGRRVRILGEVSAKTNSMNMSGEKDGPRMSVKSEALYGTQAVELVLAIDISSSMNSGRLEEAKEAAKGFVETLLSKPELKNNIHISIVPFGGTVKVPDGLRYMVANQQDLKDFDHKKHWLARRWNNCFIFETADLRDGIKPSDRFDSINDFFTWNNQNPWCPRRGNQFLALNNNKQNLLKKIDGLTLSDGTGTDHGLAWARANLSSDWRGRLPGAKSGLPQEASSEVLKFIVLMSDGGVTSQHHVSDKTADFDYDKGKRPPYYTRREVRVSGTESRATFDYLCDKTRSEGKIQIITIAYQVRLEDDQNRLKACAISEDKFYMSDSGELSNIFDDVINNITPIRLSF